MKKAIKIILGVVGVLIVIIVAAAIFIVSWVDPNDYKDEIAAVVKDNTGRDLAIEGKIGLSLFPWLGLELGPTRLSNARGFGREPFAKISTATIRVKLLPLLQKRLEMDKLIVKGLALNLIKDKAGRTNWQDLARPSRPSLKVPKAKKREPATGALAGLAVGGLRIRDSRIHWSDQKSGVRYALDNLALTTGRIRPGKPFELELGFDLKDQNGLEGQVSLVSKISLGSALKRIRLDGTDFKIRVKGKKLPPKGIEARLRSTVALDLAKQTLELPNVNLESLGMTLAGRFKGLKIVDTPQLTGRLKVSPFSPRKVLDALGQTAPRTADSSALTKASFNLLLRTSAKSVTVDKLALRLDDSTVNGRLSLRNFRRPGIRFDIRLDGINLDRYLPPPTKKQKQRTTTKRTAASRNAAGLPLQALGALNLKGTLRIGKLKAQKLKLSDIRFAVNAQNGRLRIEPATAKLYNGGYNGNVRLQAAGSTPRLSTDQKLKGVQAGPLVKDLLGAKKISGTTNLSARISALGADAESMRRSMSGNVEFALSDGALEGINVVHVVCKAWATYKQQPPPSEQVGNRTTFASLGGTAKITNGVMKSDDLLLTSSLLKSKGKGTVDLVGEKIDYLIQTVFKNPVQCEGGKTIKELQGVTLPIRITGALSKPKYSLDIETLLKAQLKSRVGEKIRKKLGGKIPESLRKGLERFFK
ncbi:MAG: AsmA family protein [Candidatus Binatia bacterium]